MSNMQHQAVQNTWAMADRLAGRADSWTAVGVHWSGYGGQEPARAVTGRTSQAGRAGRRQHRRGHRFGGGRPSARNPGVRDTVREAACPAEEAPS